MLEAHREDRLVQVVELPGDLLHISEKSVQNI